MYDIVLHIFSDRVSLIFRSFDMLANDNNNDNNVLFTTGQGRSNPHELKFSYNNNNSRNEKFNKK